MNLEPLFDRVVISPLPQKQTTSSGLILPESSSERPLLGKVICVGPGNEIDGKLTKMHIKKGDTVLYSKYGGIEFKLEGENQLIIRQTDILAIIKEDK